MNHFNEVLKDRETRPIPEPSEACIIPFTTDEVMQALITVKPNKACGPDMLYNEHLKDTAEHLKTVWTAFYNKCLEEGQIPENWRLATLKVLYKGKGNASDPHSYRDIALECCPFKVLTCLLIKTLYKLTESTIPEEQFGFMKGRSTLQAVKCLLDDIDEALGKRKGKLHAIFVDYKKAFDLLNRSILIDKVERMVGKNYITRILRNIMARNLMQIDDNIDLSQPIDQTNGVLQGDPLSPLLFNIATADIPNAIQTEGVRIYAYADDMVLTSTDIRYLQTAFNKLVQWAINNEMQINKEKTVTMTFRKGGRAAANDVIHFGAETLTMVPHFKYLGVTLQTHGNTFTKHIKDRASTALIAMHDIKNITRLSLETAMKPFNLKISPIMTYGIDLIWEHLNKDNLQDIERIKASFLKKALGLSKFTPSRITYLLSKEPFYLSKLRLL